MTWVPWRWSLDDGSLQLVEVDPRTFREPFIEVDFDRALQDGAPTHWVDADHWPTSLGPAVIVVHPGRSGSTLVSRGLDALGVVNYREPQSFVDWVHACVAESGPERRMRGVGPRLARAFGAATDAPTAIKLSSIVTPLVGSLVPALSATLFVAIVRDVEQVLRSVLASPPSHSQLLYSPLVEVDSYWPGAIEALAGRPLTLPRLVALSWSAAVDAIAAIPASRRLLIDYEDLVADPAMAYLSIHERIGLPPPERRTVDRLLAVFGTHSKRGDRYGSDAGGLDFSIPEFVSADVERMTATSRARLAEARLVE